MKSKIGFKIGFISIFLFMIIATYLWYLYFNEHEGENVKNLVGLQFINSGGINYINAKVDDTDEVIPTYYFRIRNNMDTSASYLLTFKQVSPSDVNDGCSEGNTFLPDELSYELRLDSRLVKTGIVSDLMSGSLYNNSINGSTIQDYSLRIRLNENAQDYENKHFHYVVDFKEK